MSLLEALSKFWQPYSVFIMSRFSLRRVPVLILQPELFQLFGKPFLWKVFRPSVGQPVFQITAANTIIRPITFSCDEIVRYQFIILDDSVYAVDMHIQLSRYFAGWEPFIRFIWIRCFQNINDIGESRWRCHLFCTHMGSCTIIFYLLHYSFFHNGFPSFFSGKNNNAQKTCIDKKQFYYFLSRKFEQKSPEHPTSNRKHGKMPSDSISPHL